MADIVPAAATEAAITGWDLARLFHTTYERLAPSFGYQTRPETAVPWDQIPDTNANKALMVAVATEVLAAAVPAIAAQAAATERERCQAHLREIVITNASDNDTLLGALVDAIRELAP